MSDPLSAAALPSRAEPASDTDEFLRRFYRQMGVYAVAAALDLSFEPIRVAAIEREDRALPADCAFREAA